jgi:hypothetical protein
MAAAAVASRLSDRRTEGRDAVRVVGRPAIATPVWHVVRSIAERGSVAEWGPADLGWGLAYEPHRHADGALIGGRLALRPGRYRLALLGQDLSPQAPVPALIVHAEPSGIPRSTPFERAAGEWDAPFEVHPGERAVTLRLRGGGPVVLDRLRLFASTISTDPGLNGRREGPR